MKKLLNVKVFFSSKTNKKKISQNMFWQKKVQHYQARHEKLKEPQALGNRISFTY